MYCQQCGEALADEASFCPRCGTRRPPAGTTESHLNYSIDSAALVGYEYAAFWPRLGAYLLDLLFSLLLAAIPAAILATILGLLVYAGQEEAFTQAQQDRNDEDLGIAIVVGALLAYIPVTFAYYLIGTANGGAWGKRIANIRIVRERDGQKPGYGSALGRVLITWIFSAIPLVGNIVWLVDNLSMLWDGENQTWHDKVAGTIVIRAS